MGRTTCGWFFDQDQRVLYSSTYKAGARCPVPPDMSKGYTWGLFDYDIYTAKPDGSDLKQLTTTPRYDAESVVSPDGKRIVFTSLRDGDLELYTMNIDGTDVRRVTHQLGYDGGAVWSPDGKQLAWRAFHPETDKEKSDYLELIKQNWCGRPAWSCGWGTWTAPGLTRSPSWAEPTSPLLHAEWQAAHLRVEPQGTPVAELRPVPGQPGRYRAHADHHSP